MNTEQIYKIYKYGGSFKHKNLKPEKIFKALRSCGIEVFMVIDYEGNKRVHNYIPEINKFELIY